MEAPISSITKGAGGDPLALRRPDSTGRTPGKAAATAAQAARAAKDPPPVAELIERARNATQHLAGLAHRLQFHVDEGSGQVVVAVVDADTSEVLKQMPAEEMLEVARRLEEQLGSHGDAIGVLLSDSA